MPGTHGVDRFHGEHGGKEGFPKWRRVRRAVKGVPFEQEIGRARGVVAERRGVHPAEKPRAQFGVRETSATSGHVQGGRREEGAVDAAGDP